MSNNQQVPNSVNTDDEITLRQILLKVIEFVQEGWRNKWLVLVFVILMMGVFLVNAFFETKNFRAEMTFMLNEQEGGANSPFSSILGSFGIPSGGSGNGLNLDRLVYLTYSKEIIYSALFDKTNIEGSDDFIANHIIREYNLHHEWKKDTTGLRDFLFKTSDLSLSSRLENKVIEKIFKLILKKDTDTPTVGCSYSNDTRVLTLNVLSTSEQLSRALHESIYKYLSKFYVTRTIEQQKNTFDLMKSKVDSLRNLLYGLDNRIARDQDSSLGLIDRISAVARTQIERERQIVSVAYAEAVRQLEIADFTLKSNTPVFQVIDEVLPPLPRTKVSKVEAIILGGLLGGFLGVAFVFIRKIIRDAMRTSDNVDKLD